LAFASNQPIEQWFGNLELSFDKAHIRTERLDKGIAVLCDHDWRDHVGTTEGFTIDAKAGVMRTSARFGSGQRAAEIFNDVKDGIRKEVSVGFMIYDLELISDKDGESTYRSNDWMPYEISLVSVPADISVGVGRSLETAKAAEAEITQTEQRKMADK